jgi:uncharacterized protein YcbX
MHVEALWRYPVKSMGGEPTAEAALTAAGVEGDRAFAVVDRTDGTVASAKHPRKWAGLLHFRAAYVRGPESAVVITFPDGSEMTTEDDDLDDRLSKALGRDVTLSRSVPETASYEADWPALEGVVPDEFLAAVRTGEGEDGGTLTSLQPRQGTFLDVAAVHLVASATLAHLAELAPESVFDVRRYRPNIVIGGAEGEFVENGWTSGELAVGPDARLLPLIPTMRCVMTTLPQGELPRDPGTLRAVATHNRIDIPGAGVWSCVGLYAEVAAGGTVRVGDAFRV